MLAFQLLDHRKGGDGGDGLGFVGICVFFSLVEVQFDEVVQLRCQHPICNSIACL